MKNSDKIYTQFLKKIECHKGKKTKKFPTIVSFETSSDRDKFASNHQDLEIGYTFSLIPSLSLLLTKSQIQSLTSDRLIKVIEEDQKLELSMLETLKFLDFFSFKKTFGEVTGKEVSIGIIDNGISKKMDTISKNVVESHVFSNGTSKQKEKDSIYTHGTIIANLICSNFKDKKHDYIGLAPDVDIVDLSISNFNGKYYFSNVLEVLDFIIEKKLKLDILLISFVSSKSSDGSDILSRACNLLSERNIIILCPAGNTGPEPYTIGSPGAARKVITVGALTKEEVVSNFSGRGPTLDERTKPDICLPGSNIQIPITKGKAALISGTCVSAGIAAGILALIKEYNSDLTYHEAIDLLRKSSVNLNFERNSQGYGTINISSIFKRLHGYPEKLISYDYLIKRSLVISIEFVAILIVIFYLASIFNFLRAIFGF
jgi:serine protease AprX